MCTLVLQENQKTIGACSTVKLRTNHLFVEAIAAFPDKLCNAFRHFVSQPSDVVGFIDLSDYSLQTVLMLLSRFFPWLRWQ